LLKVGSTQCGKVNGSWISGKVTKIKSKNYFISYTKSSQLYSSDAKKSRGAQKKKLLNLSTDFGKKSTAGNKKCSRYNVSIPVATTVPIATSVAPANQVLKFDFSNAVALTLTDATVSTASIRKYSLGSNLEKVSASGVRSDAVVSGAASIRRFLIAPNNKLYVEFLDNTQVDGATCLLAEIARESGIPQCIERDKDFRFLGVGQDPNNFCNCSDDRPLRNDIQFDKDGNIYYAGIPGTWKRDPTTSFALWTGVIICSKSPCGMASVVRRYSNGEVRDFGSSAIGRGGVDLAWHFKSVLGSAFILRPILNFLVLDNGSVLIHAQRDLVRVPTPECPNCYNQPMGTDLWSSSGQLLESNFPTGPSALLANIGPNRTIMAVTKTATLNSNYVAISADGVAIPVFSAINEETAGKISSTCASLSTEYDFTRFVCGGGGVRQVWRTPSGEVFVVAGQDPFSKIESYNRSETKDSYELWVKEGAKYGSGVLLRVFPTLISTRVGLPQDSLDLSRIETFTSAFDEFYASGLTSNGQRQTIVYNTVKNTSNVLIPASSDIRITKMAFSAKMNSLLFVGVQGSAGESIFGVLDRLTNKLVVTSNPKNVSDLQAFSS
jgi:hypothetical protein